MSEDCLQGIYIAAVFEIECRESVPEQMSFKPGNTGFCFKFLKHDANCVSCDRGVIFGEKQYAAI